MRYENPLYLAEEVAALDLLTDQRIAIGISRGSPEQARRGWETFGYTGGVDPRGADVAHAHTAGVEVRLRDAPDGVEELGGVGVGDVGSARVGAAGVAEGLPAAAGLLR